MPNSRKPTPRNPRTPPSSQRHTTPQSTTRERSSAPELSGAPELVDPRWILKALAIVFATALLLSWGTLCLLWYQGQWQLVLHPSRTVVKSPASAGIKFTELHFAVDATGQPQLDGWYIPADVSSAPTALMLHSGDGSDSDALPGALLLHNARLNVLLFDYRGYGKSTGLHPKQASMQQDAESAFTYLTATQHIPPQSIIIYGHGIGASLAVNLAAQHRDISAIILDAPDGDLTDRVARDPHSSLVPARLLFHEQFPLAAPLHTLTTPKLLISYDNRQPPPPLATAADPKITVELSSSEDPALIPVIERFVDQYVTGTPQATRP